MLTQNIYFSLRIAALSLVLIFAPKAFASECADLLSQGRLAHYSKGAIHAYESLVALGYDESIASRMVTTRHPSIIQKIIDARVPPLFLYRGVNTTLDHYDPRFTQGLSSAQWVSRDLDQAEGFTRYRGRGFLIEFQMPETVYGTESLHRKIPRDEMPDDREFIFRIGIFETEPSLKHGSLVKYPVVDEQGQPYTESVVWYAYDDLVLLKQITDREMNEIIHSFWKNR